MYLYKRVYPPIRPSICLSVCPLECPSVACVQKPHFPDVFGHGEILYWNKWSTNVLWEPPLLLCHFIGLFVHLSLHIWHMFNTHRDTVRTHRCPVGLVAFLLLVILNNLRQSTDTFSVCSQHIITSMYMSANSLYLIFSDFQPANPLTYDISSITS